MTSLLILTVGTGTSRPRSYPAQGSIKSIGHFGGGGSKHLHPAGNLPFGKNILINSPWPHTEKLEKSLNHFPFGTSGFVSSQSARAAISS